MAEAKLDIRIGEIRIELEGPSDFVSKHYDKIEKHLETYVKLSKTAKKTVKAENNNPPIPATVENIESADVENETNSESSVDFPETFGEWLNAIPKNTSDTRKALLAGYYTQLNSSTNTFRSRDISKLLKEHSIKLSNTSMFVRGLAKSKKTFQHSKNGSEANYKVSRDTETELKKMFE